MDNLVDRRVWFGVLARVVVAEGQISCDRGADCSIGEVDVISNLLAISCRTTGMVLVSIDYQPLYGKML